MAVAHRDSCDDHWGAVLLEMSFGRKGWLAKGLLPTHAQSQQLLGRIREGEVLSRRGLGSSEYMQLGIL